MSLLLEEVTENTVGDAVELASPVDVYISMPNDRNIVVWIDIKSTNTDWQTLYETHESASFTISPVGPYALRASRSGGTDPVTVEVIEAA